MSHLSLLLLLAGLTAAPAPQDPAPAPKASTAPQARQKKGYGGIVGSNDPRWMSRSESRKVLGEFGGVSLINAWQGTWIWINEQTPEEDVLLPSESGRGAALNALVALSMSGNGSGIRSGAQRDQFRSLTRALRAVQTEAGAYVASSAAERALDQALAVHCMAEATISNPVEALFGVNQRGVDALLALRGEDGLWHVGGGKDGAVDALTCGVAAYALYTAYDAGAELDPAVFEALVAWSAKAPIEGADDGEKATNAVAILGARVFASQALERGLKDDARSRELLAALDPWLPSPAKGDRPASAGQAERNDFAYLASVVLYQADNVRWNRLYTWVVERAIADTRPEDSTLADGAQIQESNGGLPAGRNGRLPAGALATSALRVLQMQSSFREPALGTFAN